MKEEEKTKKDDRGLFLDFDRVIGLGLAETNKRLVENLSGKVRLGVGEAPKDVKELLLKRNKARKSKDWGGADELREEIGKRGYNIEDVDGGAQLVKK